MGITYFTVEEYIIPEKYYFSTLKIELIINSIMLKIFKLQIRTNLIYWSSSNLATYANKI